MSLFGGNPFARASCTDVSQYLRNISTPCHHNSSALRMSGSLANCVHTAQIRRYHSGQLSSFSN